MEALQVEYQESLAGLLESRFGGSGRPVVVRNTAVGGWDPPQYLLQARRSLSQERFDLVIVSLYLGNDIVDQQLERIAPRVPTEVHYLRLPRKASWDELVDAWLYPVNDALEVRSHLFVLLKNQSQTLRMKMGLSAAYFPDQFRTREAESSRWAVTADICRGIADLADSYGVPIIFMLLPTSYQVDADAFDGYLRGFDIDSAGVDLDQPNRLLGHALEARGLTVLDPVDALRREHGRGVRLYGRVDTHFNANGHRVVERFIEPSVGSFLDRDSVSLTSGRGLRR